MKCKLMPDTYTKEGIEITLLNLLIEEEKLQKDRRLCQESLCLYECKRFNLHDKDFPPLPNCYFFQLCETMRNNMAFAIHFMQSPWCNVEKKEAGPMQAVLWVRFARHRTLNSHQNMRVQYVAPVRGRAALGVSFLQQPVPSLHWTFCKPDSKIHCRGSIIHSV